MTGSLHGTTVEAALQTLLGGIKKRLTLRVEDGVYIVVPKD